VRAYLTLASAKKAIEPASVLARRPHRDAPSKNPPAVKNEKIAAKEGKKRHPKTQGEPICPAANHYLGTTPGTQ
jgi:hypothetical protein